VPSSTTTVAPSPTTTGGLASPPGSVTFRAGGVVLPDPATVPEGLRVVVGPAPSYTVRPRGRVAVEVCATDAGGPVRSGPRACVRPASGQASEVPGDAGTAGVEVRQVPGAGGRAGGPAVLDEVTVTYLPTGRSITLVVPPTAPGSCGANECEATFALAPTGPGTLRLEARPGGGRPQLSLLSGPPGRPGSRALATVEGGSSLSVRSTVDGGSAPLLVFREKDPGAVPALAIDLFWP
jgi:hypothetical protein